MSVQINGAQKIHKHTRSLHVFYILRWLAKWRRLSLRYCRPIALRHSKIYKDSMHLSPFSDCLPRPYFIHFIDHMVLFLGRLKEWKVQNPSSTLNLLQVSRNTALILQRRCETMARAVLNGKISWQPLRCEPSSSSTKFRCVSMAPISSQFI